MPLSDYPAWELEPRKLSPEEIADPTLVINAFFDYGHIPQIRADFWNFFKTLVAGTYNDLKRSEKNDFIALYERLERLVEAAHILHRKGVNLPHGKEAEG
jgi:hypothetical protein